MAKKQARKGTVCQTCGGSSYNGHMCKFCKKYYGTYKNAVAAIALRKRLDACKDFDDITVVLGSVCDVIVPDWPGVSLPRLLHSTLVSPRDPAR